MEESKRRNLESAEEIGAKSGVLSLFYGKTRGIINSY